MNNIRCHKQNDSPNRNDLSSFLKVVNDVEVERRAGGKLFHARGPAMMGGGREERGQGREKGRGDLLQGVRGDRRP